MAFPPPDDHAPHPTASAAAPPVALAAHLLPLELLEYIADALASRCALKTLAGMLRTSRDMYDTCAPHRYENLTVTRGRAESLFLGLRRREEWVARRTTRRETVAEREAAYKVALLPSDIVMFDPDSEFALKVDKGAGDMGPHGDPGRKPKFKTYDGLPSDAE
ncbi:hypothetical protein Q5752_005262 [Cryptotrichosporon argae]